MWDFEEFSSIIKWHLPPTPDESILKWARKHIEDTLAQGSVEAWYIGITHLISERWMRRDDGSGHNELGWHRMSLIYVSDLWYNIAGAEMTLLKQYRFLGPLGKRLGWRVHNRQYVRGHPLCTNKAPGGAGGNAGTPPHVLYILWKWSR